MDGLNCPLSIRRQAELLSVNRSSYYYGEPALESEENLSVMRFMDESYLEHPELGVRKLVIMINAEGTGLSVNVKRVRRLREKMGLLTVYRAPRTTVPGAASKVKRYLLRNLTIDRPNQVWCTDITYIRMPRGFLYLTAIMDWYSRRILAWRLSSTMDVGFCLEALHEAIRISGRTPEILNSDQGCQYTSDEWQQALNERHIAISMDGKRRWVDNVMIERFWRTIKYDEVYLRDYQNGHEAHQRIGTYIAFYNASRPHASLAMLTPDAVYAAIPQKSSGGPNT